MLVQFTVENFMSFEKETTFSMVASSDSSHPNHLILPENGEKGKTVLRAAALYGANASGKSNLIKAVAFARNLIVNGTRADQSIPVQPFRLSDARQHPSRFQFLFKTNGVVYEYGFVLDRERIHSEWLFGTPAVERAKEQQYFARETTADKETHVEFGTVMARKATRERQRLEFVAEGTRPNQLFLYEAVERNVGVAKTVRDWFARSIQTLTPEDTVLDGAHKDLIKMNPISNFLSLLQEAGTGIESISIQTTPLDIETMKDEKGVIYLPYEAHEGRNVQFFVDEPGNSKAIELKIGRKDRSGQTINFLPEEESDGTQRLLYLLPTLNALQNEEDVVFFIDELDRRLHTLLSRAFVSAALSGTSQRSQLIFTTHDTNMLDLDLLRRDELWFLEKNSAGDSQIYSLAEFKIRPDLKVEKGYLNGRFGAIPYFGNGISPGSDSPDAQHDSQDAEQTPEAVAVS